MAYYAISESFDGRLTAFDIDAEGGQPASLRRRSRPGAAGFAIYQQLNRGSIARAGQAGHGFIAAGHKP